MTAGIDISDLSTTVRPQDDLYRYANGPWLERTEIPADKAIYGAFHALLDTAEQNVRGIVEQTAADQHPEGTEARKIGDLYTSFMDEDTVERLGSRPDRGPARAGRVHQGPGRPRRRARRAGAPGCARDLLLRRRHRREEVRRVHRVRDPGRHQPAGRVVLPRGQLRRRADGVRGAPGPDARPGRAARRHRGGRPDPRARDPAGKRPLGPGQEPRRLRDLQQARPGRARGADPRAGLVRLAGQRRLYRRAPSSSWWSDSPTTSLRLPRRCARWS